MQTIPVGNLLSRGRRRAWRGRFPDAGSALFSRCRAGSKHQENEASHFLGRPLGARDFFGILYHAVHKLMPDFLVRLFAPAEHEGGLYAVSLSDEFADAAQLGFVIVVIHIGMEFDFLDALCGLVLPRLFFFLRQLKFVFAEIHDPANGRLCGGGYLDEIEVCVARAGKGLVGLNNAQLLAIGADEAYRGNANLIIYSSVRTNDRFLRSLLCAGRGYRGRAPVRFLFLQTR